jgi:hypothetical protein
MSGLIHQLFTSGISMDTTPQIYRLKADTSGRIVLPTEAREHNHITGGDTVVVVDDSTGMQMIAEV